MKENNYSSMTLNELKISLNETISKISKNKKKSEEINDQIFKLIVSFPILMILASLAFTPMIAMPVMIKLGIPLYTIMIVHLTIKNKNVEKLNNKLLKHKNNINNQIDNIISMKYEKERYSIDKKYNNKSTSKAKIKNRIQVIKSLKKYRNQLKRYGILYKDKLINNEINTQEKNLIKNIKAKSKI